jgi:hypothetical protein
MHLTRYALPFFLPSLLLGALLACETVVLEPTAVTAPDAGTPDPTDAALDVPAPLDAAADAKADARRDAASPQDATVDGPALFDWQPERTSGLNFFTPSLMIADPMTPRRFMIAGSSGGQRETLLSVWSNGTLSPVFTIQPTEPVQTLHGAFDQAGGYHGVLIAQAAQPTARTAALAGGRWTWQELTKPLFGGWPARRLLVQETTGKTFAHRDDELLEFGAGAFAPSWVAPAGQGEPEVFLRDGTLLLRARRTLARCEFPTRVCLTITPAGLASDEALAHVWPSTLDVNQFFVLGANATGASLYVSGDQGATLTRIPPPPGLDFGRVGVRFAVNPKTLNTVSLVHQAGAVETLWETKDGGTTWQTIQTPTNPGGLNAIVYDAAGTLFLWRGTMLFSHK